MRVSGLDCLCFNGKECSNYDDDGKLFDCSAIETIDYSAVESDYQFGLFAI